MGVDEGALAITKLRFSFRLSTF